MGQKVNPVGLRLGTGCEHQEEQTRVLTHLGGRHAYDQTHGLAPPLVTTLE